MKFRYVIYGDIYTDEKENKILAREEAEYKLDNIVRELPNANIDSLTLWEDLMKGENHEERSAVG